MRTKKIAAEFAPGSDMVQLLDRGIIMERADAIAAGYAVSASIASTMPSASASPVKGPEKITRSWRSAIINAPEAKGRDDATAELLTKHSHETLSVDDARAFLRGLPLEQSEPKASNVTKSNEDPHAARKTEIANSMAAFNTNSGYGTRACDNGQGATPTSVDPAKLKRLAELRLNALENGQAYHVGDEAKKLRYALQVHDTTGAPLANVFAQLGVDTSKIVR